VVKKESSHSSPVIRTKEAAKIDTIVSVFAAFLFIYFMPFLELFRAKHS
jgi:hypothetical protein